MASQIKLQHVLLATFAGCVLIYFGTRTGVPSGNSVEQGQIAAGCSPTDFQISDLSGSRHFELATITGRIASRCTKSAIVRLRWIVQNEDGTTSSFAFYAHDGTQIGPNESYYFRISEDIPPGHSSYRVVIDDVSTQASYECLSAEMTTANGIQTIPYALFSFCQIVRNVGNGASSPPPTATVKAVSLVRGR